MRSLPLAVALAAFGLLAAPAAPASAAGAGKLVRASVHEPPTVVPGTDRRRHLIYEILLENRAREAVRVDRLLVRDPSRRRALAAYRGRRIASVMAGADGAPRRTLAPGDVAAAFLDVVLPPRRRAPARLAHLFVLSPGAGPDVSRRVTIAGASTRVAREGPLRIGPPLRGERLAVIGCCGAVVGHRRALMEVDGRLSLSQRYAIDFARVDEDLMTFAGEPTRNESYFIFGDEVVAVAPGKVVATRNDQPEGSPPNAPPPDLDTATGNYVTQDLGGGRVALYAHLQAGSVRVGPGEQVQRGQVLGLVGNTGLSTEAHLHFHVVDGPGEPARLGGDGVAYVFDRFAFDAHVAGLEDDPPAPVVEPAPPPREREGQYPFTGDIVGFP